MKTSSMPHPISRCRVDMLFCKEFQIGPGLQLVLVPPIGGWTPPLDARLAAFVALIEHLFGTVRAVEFPGQNGHRGRFSIAGAASSLRSFIAKDPIRKFILFGICSGATASVWAATKLPNVIGVFAWEMSLRYEYSMRYARYYALRFAIRFEEETVLDAIQPVDFVAGLPCPIAFANGGESPYSRPDDQRILAALARHPTCLLVPGVTHFLGGSNGVAALAVMFERWYAMVINEEASASHSVPCVDSFSEKIWEERMDPLASTVIGIIAPYLVKGAEEFSKSAGAAAFDGVKALAARLSRWWDSEPVAAAAVKGFAANPARYGKVLAEQLEVDIQANPTLASDLRQLLVGLGPEVDVLLRIELAKGVCGADIEELLRGTVHVEIVSREGENITGLKIGRVG